MLFVVDTFGALFGALSSLGLTPTWPAWVTGTGTGTIRGSFVWLSNGVAPMAGWINLGLMGSIASLVITLQAGFLTWALVGRIVAAIRGASPV